jgi:hypothetical protein
MAVATIVCASAQAQSSSPPSVADVKMLAKGGISDEVILSQIRSSHATYRLSTADILDLKESGVGEKVIDFMINTASGGAPPPSAIPTPSGAPTAEPSSVPPPPPSVSEEVVVGAPPPPPIVEEITVAPGPRYVWISGAWRWHRGRWAWVQGHWDLPPWRGAIWIAAGWDHHGGRVVWSEGYWR